MRLLALLALAAAAAAGDAKQEAWSAFRAGEQGAKDAIPQLLDALQKEPGARRWILDALIRLKAEVPAEGVAGLFKEFPEETLILLARDPKENEEHLAAIADAAGASNLHLHWVAACNLLAAQKSKRLAAPLLRDLELGLEIWLADSDTLGGGEGERGPGFGKEAGLGPSDPQWPPIPTYALSDRQGVDAVPFATGRKMVFYVRRAAQPGERRTRVRRSDPAECWHRQRVGYLADLLGVDPSRLDLYARHYATVTWRGEKTYPADVAAARERVETAYRDVVTKLVEKQLLDLREAPKGPRLKVRVTDRRTDKSVALPALHGVEVKPD